MRVRLHYVFVAVAWSLLLPGTQIDAAIYENPDTVHLVASPPSTPPAELFFRINMVELGILTAGCLLGARLSKFELELRASRPVLRLSRVVDAGRLGQ